MKEAPARRSKEAYAECSVEEEANGEVARMREEMRTLSCITTYWNRVTPLNLHH